MDSRAGSPSSQGRFGEAKCCSLDAAVWLGGLQGPRQGFPVGTLVRKCTCVQNGGRVVVACKRGSPCALRHAHTCAHTHTLMEDSEALLGLGVMPEGYLPETMKWE